VSGADVPDGDGIIVGEGVVAFVNPNIMGQQRSDADFAEKLTLRIYGCERTQQQQCQGE